MNLSARFLRLSDPVTFARSLGLEPDDWQQQLLLSDSRRIILACARQVGKTTATAIMAYYHARIHRNYLVVLVSRSLRQSMWLFGKVSQAVLAESDISHVENMNKTELMLKNGSNIIAVPGSAETVRGFSGPNLVIFDEAAYIEDKLFNAMTPMVAVSNGRLVLLSSPGAKSGFFWTVWNKGGDIWERYSITAQDCPRITDATLEEEKGRMLDHVFRREYGAEFTESAEALVSDEDIQAAYKNNVKPLIKHSLINNNISALRVS